jgi:hypothetical protein
MQEIGGCELSARLWSVVFDGHPAVAAAATIISHAAY